MPKELEWGVLGWLYAVRVPGSVTASVYCLVLKAGFPLVLKGSKRLSVESSK